MQLKVYKSLWGMEGALEEQFKRIKEAGYDGVESAAQEITDPAKFRALLKDYDLDYIALIYTEGNDHTTHFDRVIDNALTYSPSKIVAHAGRDIMPFVRQIRFFVHALLVEEKIGVPIAHETHRRRPLFSPMNTVSVLRELPDLRVNIDYSHWCCVTESMLEDHREAIELTSEHTIHFHGRVGYENGPQVPDPRVSEWESRVTKHEEWWDLALRSLKGRNERYVTFTPEYGPPTYMHTLPGTGQPTANLWDVCLWAAERFRNQFSKHIAAQVTTREVAATDATLQEV